MIYRAPFTLFMLIGLVLLASCSLKPASPTPVPTVPISASPAPKPAIPNPASVYCIQNGGKLDLRTDASGAVAGVCVFPDGSECDEWAYFRGECQPAGAIPSGSPTTAQVPPSAPTDNPTQAPIDPADYQGWWTYTNPTYGFSILLPSDWVVDDTATGDPLMSGHMLILHSQQPAEAVNIRMTFRSSGEENLLWPTGVGSGTFIQQGTLDVTGNLCGASFSNVQMGKSTPSGITARVRIMLTSRSGIWNLDLFSAIPAAPARVTTAWAEKPSMPAR